MNFKWKTAIAFGVASAVLISVGANRPRRKMGCAHLLCQSRARSASFRPGGTGNIPARLHHHRRGGLFDAVCRGARARSPAHRNCARADRRQSRATKGAGQIGTAEPRNPGDKTPEPERSAKTHFFHIPFDNLKEGRYFLRPPIDNLEVKSIFLLPAKRRRVLDER